MISTPFFDVQSLTDILAGGFAACIAELYQNDFVPTRESVIGDFTVATYTGYASKVPTWSAPSLADDGNAESIGTMTEWRPTGSVTTNVIYGVLLKKAVSFELLLAARFSPAPLPMGSALDVILTTLRLRITQSGLVLVIS